MSAKDLTQPVQTQYLANAQLVLEGEVLRGALVIEDGHIAAIDTGGAVPAGAIDMEGEFLAPGLIELHTDNLERHITPRPKANWPHGPAILAHDAELAGCGITTVFDALRVGSISRGNRTDYAKYARQVGSEILDMHERGVLRISHRLHLRAETCSQTLMAELDEFGPQDRVGIVSIMDHTPGQRQFTDIEKFADYIIGKHGYSRSEFDEYCTFLCNLHGELGEKHERATVAAAARFGAVLASHDDTTAAQVAVSAGHGVAMAEFPTTVAAAQACNDAGIATIMGAPNLVRGGSHSGNVAASALAEASLLDILSSDYVPAALLMGAVMLSDIWGDMARGMATVTAAPARATGLADRGVLEVGKRADLVRFRLLGHVPQVRETWVLGRRVA
ncbi:alpha-D-ribose 1-methylphosphonate 5-triphosphate diphosphatase [Aliishimia ponticola]|uniref:Alpha-D-ribose 1-methylphosphonate 5-triphosphate diphosphatase n=1 Tax=Aliishimia ponticola TaxID=2499833 RepID=A0A4S4NGD0_9RHOB|nr:alpha-D-ribose 1-methylphosphonate 5-triphosphate diphosphatase [Aliishimia ponticola]THH37191.1 alpha-D-ribose 1-methylphosphonate 5-triphosphate diphosphatase [Aliishimia ponticola]